MSASGPCWEEISKSHEIHEETVAFTAVLTSLGAKPLHNLPVEEARKQSLELASKLSEPVEFDGDVRDYIVPSPHVSSGIPITVYTPTNCGQTPAIFIYFHGGGLVVFDRKSYEPTLKTISKDAGAIVVNVEYRLLPDVNALYAPFDDAVVVTEWVMENREGIGGKPESKVGVGGDNSGGQLAACVTNEVRGLDFQVLIYPNVDLSLSQESFKEFSNVPGLVSSLDIQWFHSLTSDRLTDGLTNPRVNAMARSTGLESSPPALILLAQVDPIRDSGLAYAEKLRGSEVGVRIMVIEGVPHMFFGFSGVFKTKCQEAYGHVVHFIKEYQQM